MQNEMGADACEIVDLLTTQRGAYALVRDEHDPGRTTLLRLSAGAAKTLAVSNFGNSVHEYGLCALSRGPDGCAATLKSGGIGRLHASQIETYAQGHRLGDPVYDGRSGSFIAVEEPTGAEASIRDHLVSVGRGGEHRVLFEGPDFLSRPAIAPNGRKVAFLAWNLPHMPWEAAQLWLGDWDGEHLSHVRALLSPGGAVAQPRWGPDGLLYALCDAAGWFQLWRWGAEIQPQRVTRQSADFGLSMSRQTHRSWDFGRPGVALAIQWSEGIATLLEVDLASGDIIPRPAPDLSGDQIAVAGDELWYAAVGPTGARSIRHLDADNRSRIIWQGSTPNKPSSTPPHRFALVARDGELIYADHHSTDGSGRRGLTVVNLHGGPAGVARQTLPAPLRILRRAGYDIVELHYRGSAGFGRAYRERLYGHWGEADVDDVASLALELERLGLAQPQTLVLRGASAGGFTALNALTGPVPYAAGMIHYGVSDLQELGRHTHRYERRYLNTLVGADSLANDLFKRRSPIHRLDDIHAPLLWLQGDLDPVCPPEQAFATRRRLQASGRDLELVILEGERHGFVRLENQVLAVEAELAFLSRLEARAAREHVRPSTPAGR